MRPPSDVPRANFKQDPARAAAGPGGVGPRRRRIYVTLEPRARRRGPPIISKVGNAYKCKICKFWTAAYLAYFCAYFCRIFSESLPISAYRVHNFTCICIYLTYICKSTKCILYKMLSYPGPSPQSCQWRHQRKPRCHNRDSASTAPGQDRCTRAVRSGNWYASRTAARRPRPTVTTTRNLGSYGAALSVTQRH